MKKKYTAPEVSIVYMDAEELLQDAVRRTSVYNSGLDERGEAQIGVRENTDSKIDVDAKRNGWGDIWED